MMSKSSLRKLMVEKLRSLNPSNVQGQSEQILDKLTKHNKFQEAHRISLYLSTTSEVDTTRILRHALEVDRKQCFVPFIGDTRKQTLGSVEVKGEPRMSMVELGSMQHYEGLRTNRYGIKEMTELDDGRTIIARASDGDLDLIIVPGVAFSLDGRRLGHGKGYYDEFLHFWALESPRPVYSIGLALREQLVDDTLPVDGHDYTLDEILVAD